MTENNQLFYFGTGQSPVFSKEDIVSLVKFISFYQLVFDSLVQLNLVIVVTTVIRESNKTFLVESGLENDH